MGFIYSLSNLVQRSTLRTFAELKVEGRENMPLRGPLIVVANHQSNMDPTLLASTMPRRLWFLAKDGLFANAVAHRFLLSYGAFPVKLEGANVAAYRWALGQLAAGRALVMFPEGTRSKGALQRARPGVVGLALKSGAPLLPVAITGTGHMGHWLRSMYPTGTLRVRVGRPFSLPAGDARLSSDALQALADETMVRVAALLPEACRGVYADMVSSGTKPAAV